MKKLILVLVLIISSQIETMAQQESQFSGTTLYNTTTPVLFSSPAYPGPNKDYDLYLRRSKNYRNVGWATLLGGVILSGVGILVASNQVYGSSTAGVLVVAGAVSGIVSIPFMIMASAYKHKANLMIKNQKTGFGVPSNVSQDITGITLQIPLGK